MDGYLQFVKTELEKQSKLKTQKTLGKLMELPVL